MSSMSSMSLSERIYFIEGMEGGKYPYSNSIYIKSGDGCLLDSGIGLDKLNALKDRVDTVFYTHWHEDHILASKLFEKRFIHAKDKPAVEDYSVFCSRYPFPLEECKDLINFFRLSFEKDMFIPFWEGDIFECGDVLIGVLYTPGHTIGHSSFILEDSGSTIIFLGDIDLSKFGPWYGGLDSDLDQFIDSINRVKELVKEKDIDTVVSGHKGVFRGKRLIVNRLQSYLYIIFEREKRIMDIVSDGIRLDDLIGKGIIYSSISSDRIYRYYAERRMLRLHINRLVRMKFLKEEDGRLYKLI